ncbi:MULTISPECIES: hypothetical protein [unclassified Mannheimia]|uniref:hypothetical protein n=1 Tax=unclassified Mannheimia TaxID=2645054 RepID=UPI00359F12EC
MLFFDDLSKLEIVLKLNGNLSMKKVIVILMTIILISCVPKPTYNQLAMKLHMGMSKQETISLLGEPKKVSAKNTDKGMVEVLSYWGLSAVGFTIVDNQMLSQDRLFVTLLNNKVTEWGDKLDPSEMMEKTQETMRETIKNSQAIYTK